MKKNYILFLDSGIGGLSTLSCSIKNNHGDYIYFADNLHAPYGKLTQNQIFYYLCQIIDSLLNHYNIKIIVLACNTATTSSIELLRKKFSSITFIGTEPAIMLAKKMGFKNPACIATPTTISQTKYKLLCKDALMCIRNIPLKNFASNIENYLISKDYFSFFEIIKTIFYIKSKLKNCDCLILGCTHYVMIKSLMEQYISIPVIDGNFGVCKLISKYNFQKTKSTVKILLSNDKNKLKQKYIKILNQTLAKA